MAIINCRECGEPVSSSAKTCPACGIDTPHRTQNITNYVLGAGFWVLVAVGIVSFFANREQAPESTCRVVASNLTEDAFLVNGEFDYGILANITVELDGPGREVVVSARLETNHGDLTKSQRINVRTDGRRSIQLQFVEPTVTTVISGGQATCS